MHKRKAPSSESSRFGNVLPSFRLFDFSRLLRAFSETGNCSAALRRVWISALLALLYASGSERARTAVCPVNGVRRDRPRDVGGFVCEERTSIVVVV